MHLDKKILDRLDGLVGRGQAILAAAHGKQTVNVYDSGQWSTSCLSLLARVFGSESDYYRRFTKPAVRIWEVFNMMQAQAVLKAAKEDYELEMLFDTQAAVRAEVFGEFLDQADQLIGLGPDLYAPAAVIVGAVLEDGLRKLCDRNGIALPDRTKVEYMNAELAREKVYNGLVQKQVTVWADIRNKAAHGKWDEFTKDDAAAMLRDVRTFMGTHFA